MRLAGLTLALALLGHSAVARAQPLAEAAALEQRGDYPAALAVIERATASGAEGLALRIGRAVMEERLGHYQALGVTTAALLGDLEPSPALAQVLALRSRFELWRGRSAQAAALLDRAAGLAAGDARLLTQILRRRGEVALAEGDFELAWQTCGVQAGSQARDLDERDRERVAAMVCWGRAMLWSKTPRTAGNLLKDAVALSQQDLGHDHPENALHVLQLASFYARSGAPERALRLHASALEVLDKRLGARSRFVSQAKAELADVLQAAGEDARAGELYREALASAERYLEAHDPDRAARLEALAIHLWTVRGDHAAAADLLARAVAVRERGAADDAFARGLLLAQLAERQTALGRIDAAVATLTRALDLVDARSTALLATGSAEQKETHAARLRGLTDQAVALHLVSAKTDPKAAALAARSVIRHKARVLDALTGSAGRGPSDEERALRATLAEKRAALASRVLARARRGEARTVDDQGFLEGMGYYEVRELEARLSRTQRAALAPVSVADVARALPEGTVLVELIAFMPPALRWQRGTPRHAALRYGAYVLHPGGELAWTDLGDGDAIDAKVIAVGKAMQEKREVGAEARALDALVVQPIRPLLQGKPLVFLAPDGQLSLVPYPALRDENDNYLIESMSFTLLTSGRELLRMTERRASRAPALVVAAPDYGGSGGAAGADRGLFDLTRMFFPPLAETRAEAERVAALLDGAEVVVGADATESRLKALHGPRVLHVATHGYFLADKAQRLGAQSRGLELEAVGERRKLELDDPLLRSGLAFAGANVVPEALLGVGDDGLLTAMEAASLDLWGTKLVVLSACETGVGEVRNGEGVFGLRRALSLAGAETQIISLWKVDDSATRALMEATFEALTKGAGRSEALRQAQLAMIGRHPYEWAAFFTAGDPTTLEGKRAEARFPKRMPTYATSQGKLPATSAGCACHASGAEPSRIAAWLGALLVAVGLARRRLERRGLLRSFLGADDDDAGRRVHPQP
jgi:MYXO-CTERM domain-containing protein